MKTKLSIIIILIVIAQSCSFSVSPEKYFGKVALNSNLLGGFGEQDFENYMNAKSQNALYIKLENEDYEMQDMLVPHITTYVIPNIEKSIKDIKDLKVTASTEAMINASLELHEFTLEQYKTEYVKIAELIDSEVSKTEIHQEIIKFEKKYLDKFWDLHTNLMDIAIPYAKANGIEISTF
ncbi:hypothetical protein [Winogradskyella endarachnes]|uniref:Uncharacterized protein n=1 Tax=Winogradskyella endarachnes TaxID=2681965 RepID=A0A6L6UBS7_9FLAO|nr:hypothetical protein [Winogradskyella endarachnes]MUU78402.1 hypothetical protein [Winogradskyella endarachnes]